VEAVGREAAGLGVLAVVPPVANRVYGGAAIQARCTANALAELGARVDLVVTDAPDARGYDIAHVFGMTDPLALGRQLAACARAGVPVALSPIWCSWREVSARALRAVDILRFGGAQHRIDAALARIRQARLAQLLNRRDLAEFAALESAQARLMRSVAVLLPISAAELRDLRLRLGVRDVPFIIVPNGVRLGAVRPWAGQRSGVVCAARIEPGKNQHMLAYALHRDRLPITFAGDIGDERYFSVVEKWGGDRARFAGRLGLDEVMELFSRSAVHAMPSWADVTSLAHLEAAASGMRLVVGDRGFEWEYLQGDAEYADPADPESIRAAVLNALRKPPRQPGDALDRRVRELTWMRSARQTLRGYAIAFRPQPVAA
jgi:glycosyltransferase involved in cell wall biosynthesis